MIGPYLDQTVRLVFQIPGRFRVVSIADPAAGADFLQVVPSGRLWKVIAFRGRFTTDANVANREVVILLRDPANVNYYAAASTEVQAASDAVGYSVAQGLSVVGRTRSTLDDVLIPLPNDLFMPEGHIFRSGMINIQVGDQWDLLRLSVEELPFSR